MSDLLSDCKKANLYTNLCVVPVLHARALIPEHLYSGHVYTITYVVLFVCQQRYFSTSNAEAYLNEWLQAEIERERAVEFM